MENMEISYSDAYEELQSLIGEIEDDNISIDTLSEKVKRAAYLIQICKEKLTSTDEDVKNILAELDAKPVATSQDVIVDETSEEEDEEQSDDDEV